MPSSVALVWWIPPLGRCYVAGSSSLGVFRALEKTNAKSPFPPRHLPAVPGLPFLSTAVVWCRVLPKRRLRGTLSAALGDLTGLERLDLSHNEITGPIPGSLGQLFRVQEVALQMNNLTGGVPDALGNLISCTGLYLHYNNLTGGIPPSLAIIPDLR